MNRNNDDTLRIVLPADRDTLSDGFPHAIPPERDLPVTALGSGPNEVPDLGHDPLQDPPNCTDDDCDRLARADTVLAPADPAA